MEPICQSSHSAWQSSPSCIWVDCLGWLDLDRRFRYSKDSLLDVGQIIVHQCVVIALMISAFTRHDLLSMYSLNNVREKWKMMRVNVTHTVPEDNEESDNGEESDWSGWFIAMMNRNWDSALQVSKWDNHEWSKVICWTVTKSHVQEREQFSYQLARRDLVLALAGAIRLVDCTYSLP